MKEIVIKGFRDYKEMVEMIPPFADTLYDIEVNVYFYDVEVVLTPSANPQGWENIEKCIEDALDAQYDENLYLF